MSSAVRLLVLWSLGAASGVNACMISPGIPSDIDAAYARYDAVFVGEVVGLVPIDSSWARVTMRVSERLKGDVGDQVLLAAPTSMIACNPHTVPGTGYMVFAIHRPTASPIDRHRPDDTAVASSEPVTPAEAPAVVGETVASSPGDTTSESRGNFFIGDSMANLRGLPPAFAPSVPWDGDFILSVTVEVDSTSAPYSERIGSALDKLRALRAEEEQGGEWRRLTNRFSGRDP